MKVSAPQTRQQAKSLDRQDWSMLLAALGALVAVLASMAGSAGYTVVGGIVLFLALMLLGIDGRKFRFRFLLPTIVMGIILSVGFALVFAYQHIVDKPEAFIMGLPPSGFFTVLLLLPAGCVLAFIYAGAFDLGIHRE